MFRLPATGRTLLDLLQLRGDLRRMEHLLHAVLRDVREEREQWAAHRGLPADPAAPTHRIASIRSELADRERELATELLQVRAALATVALEVEAGMRTSPGPADDAIPLRRSGTRTGRPRAG